MTPRVIFLAILCQLFLVAGQIFFKRAMGEAPHPPTRARRAGMLSAGIALQALWFFIWINLLEKENLSRIFPFEGLNPVLLVAAAWLVLKERLSIHTALGVLLICGGIFLASGS